MTCSIRIVPWYDKADWQSVYDNAYSEDVELQEKAYQVMLQWQKKKKICPHGVECTSTILQVLLRDPKMNPKLPDGAQVQDLKLMYSAAVMRVVNLVCESGSKPSETMFQIAKKYSIPNWVINIRHEVAHGTICPDLDLLRSAAIYLKQWVKGHYWEVEKNSSRDFVINRPRGEVIEERLTSLLKIYYCLKNYESLGTKRVQDIPDREIREEVRNVGKLRANLILAEYIPWTYRTDESPETKPDVVNSYKMTKALRVVLKLCKDYLKTDFCSYDTCRVAVDVILEESEDESQRKLWTQLLDRMNTWGRLLPLMSCFAETCCGQGKTVRECGLWLLELSKAVLKRRKVDGLKSLMSLENMNTSGDFDNVTDPEEKRVVKKLLLKKRLDVRTSGLTVTETLMKRVEKKNPDLKFVMRLKENPRLDCREIKKIIRTLTEEPNSSSVKCVPVLIELFDPPMLRRDKKNLLTLIKIYMGDINMTKTSFFELHNVSSLVKEQVLEKDSKKEKLENEEEGSGSFEMTQLTNYNWKAIPFGVIPWDSDGKPLEKYLLSTS